MDKWAEEARIQGIIGRCPKAVPKIKCGVRSWLQFHEARFGNVDLAMPPRVCDLVAWHATHRCGGTFSNYLNYVKVMCEILEIPIDAFAHPSVKGGVKAVTKSGRFVPRAQFHIRRDLVERLASFCSMAQDLEALVMVYMASYAFLLRFPSECLAVTRMSPLELQSCKIAERRIGPIVCVHPSSVEWYFSSGRKNNPRPTSLFRQCWCSAGSVTCPVHVLAANCAALVKLERQSLQPCH